MSASRPRSGAWRALLHGEVVKGELVENQRFDTGERRFFLNSAAPVLDASGKIVAGVVSALDVTAHRKAEAALRASEERFRTAIGYYVVSLFGYVFKGMESIWPGFHAGPALAVAAPVLVLGIWAILRSVRSGWSMESDMPAEKRS